LVALLGKGRAARAQRAKLALAGAAGEVVVEKLGQAAAGAQAELGGLQADQKSALDARRKEE